MDKVLGIKWEHGKLTYQGVLTVAAPATVYGELALMLTTEVLLWEGSMQALIRSQYTSRMLFKPQRHRVR